MARDASDLAHRLAREAEAVCRHYLSNGRRQGNYWLVGDVRNTPGRSMFVRLKGGESGKGAAGKWTDAAAGDHGDLLDVIRESCGFANFREVAVEARRFLSLPRSDARIGTALVAGVGCNGIDGIGAAAVRHVASDCGHSSGDLSAQAWDRELARSQESSFPSALLLPAGR